MDALLQNPPDGVEIRADVDGLHIHMKAPSGRAATLLRELLQLTPAVTGLGGMMLTGRLLSASWLDSHLLLSFLLLGAALLVGTALGFVLGYAVFRAVGGLMGIPHPQDVAITEHSFMLGGHTLSIDDVLFIDKTTVVMRGGARHALPEGDALRPWTADLLREAIAARTSGGSLADVPAELRARLPGRVPEG